MDSGESIEGIKCLYQIKKTINKVKVCVYREGRSGLTRVGKKIFHTKNCKAETFLQAYWIYDTGIVAYRFMTGSLSKTMGGAQPA